MRRTDSAPSRSRRSSRTAAVKALIAAGADVNAAANNGLKVQALHAAVAGRNLEIVKAVLEAGADPNAQQQAGFRPIFESAANANRALAELLLAYGADPRCTSETVRTRSTTRARRATRSSPTGWRHIGRPDHPSTDFSDYTDCALLAGRPSAGLTLTAKYAGMSLLNVANSFLRVLHVLTRA